MFSVSKRRTGDFLNGAKFISDAIKNNTSLITINLNCIYFIILINIQIVNNIGENGAKYISDSLKINTTLTAIGLWCIYFIILINIK